MTLEQPRLGSDPPNGSGRERGATHLFLIHFSGILLAVKIYFNAKLWNIHQLCVLHVFIEKEIIPTKKKERKWPRQNSLSRHSF